MGVLHGGETAIQTHRCEEETPCEGAQLDEPLYRQGVSHGQTEEQEIRTWIQGQGFRHVNRPEQRGHCRLEPYDGRLSRTVLRGGPTRKGGSLLDLKEQLFSPIWRT